MKKSQDAEMSSVGQLLDICNLSVCIPLLRGNQGCVLHGTTHADPTKVGPLLQGGELKNRISVVSLSFDPFGPQEDGETLNLGQ